MACNSNNTCGAQPWFANLNEAALQNRNFRKVLWTGDHMQVTAMCIAPGCDIGLECHRETDQILCVAQGRCCVQLGDERDCLDCRRTLGAGCCCCIPAGTWHNICNTGCTPLKLFSIYAPPEHPPCTCQRTRADAD